VFIPDPAYSSIGNPLTHCEGGNVELNCCDGGGEDLKPLLNKSK
jgi:hypothetical protein